jgi:formylglycine-generating enzyme required for sulfatase activity
LDKKNEADLALLKLTDWDAAEEDIGELASEIPAGIPWISSGFPELHEFRSFGMSGTITSVKNEGLQDDLQLLSNHPVNARTSWGGVSGAPVQTSAGIVGVLTRVQDDVNTAWAASVNSLRELLVDCGVTPREAATPLDAELFDCPLRDEPCHFDLTGDQPYAPVRLVSFRSPSLEESLDATKISNWEQSEQHSTVPLVIVGDTRPDVLEILHTALLSDSEWGPRNFVETPWIRMATRPAAKIRSCVEAIVSRSPRWTVFDFTDFAFDDSSLADTWLAFESALVAHPEIGRPLLGIPRWLLAQTRVSDWLRLQQTVVKMAARYSVDFEFRAVPFDELPEEPRFRSAVLSLLKANSNCLRPALRKALAEQKSTPNLRTEERILLLSEHLFLAGFPEEALRLELFVTTSHIASAFLTLSADVKLLGREMFTGRPTANEAEALCGFLREAHDAPRVGRRIILTGDAGAGKSTTLLQVEEHWAIPPMTHGPSWFPVLLRIDVSNDDFETRLRQTFLTATLSASGDRFSRIPLFAHSRLGRHISPTSLSFVLSSPVAFLIDGITEKTASQAASWLRQINSIPSETCIVIAVRQWEVSSIVSGNALGPAHQIVQLSLRQLTSGQLRALCEKNNVDTSYSQAIVGPELAATQAMRNPYLSTRVLAVARSGRRPAIYNTYEILLAYVEEITPSDDEQMQVVYEILPKFSYGTKIGNSGDIPVRAHELAVRVGLLDPQSSPTAPRFAHRLLEDFFVAEYVVHQLGLGYEPSNVLPGHQRLWSSRWEYVLRMVLARLEFASRSSFLEFIMNRDLRLANRCAMELNIAGDAASEKMLIPSVKLAQRITSRAIENEKLDESLADGLALGYLDPRLRRDASPDLVQTPHSAEGSHRYLGRYPVTNCEFSRFVRSNGYDRKEFWNTKAAWSWRNKISFPRYWNEEHLNRPNAPVVGINLFEAQAYCEWLTMESNDWPEPMSFFLPSARDWDLTAGIVDADLLSAIHDTLQGLHLPSHLLDEDSPVVEGALGPLLAQISRAAGRFSSVLSLNQRMRGAAVPRPIGLSVPNIHGCFDMIGHIWEWCIWAPSDLEPENWRPVVKGGPLWHPDALVSNVIGGIFDPYTRFHQVGFRIAAIPRGDNR